MKLYCFYYENGNYTKKFISACKEKIEEYRNRLLSSSDNTKSIGEIKSVTLNNYEDIMEI